MNRTVPITAQIKLGASCENLVNRLSNALDQYNTLSKQDLNPFEKNLLTTNIRATKVHIKTTNEVLQKIENMQLTITQFNSYEKKLQTFFNLLSDNINACLDLMIELRKGVKNDTN